MAGYEEEFLGNGYTDSDDDVLENTYLIGRGLGNIPAPFVAPVTVVARVLPRVEVESDIGVDPSHTILARPSFQGIAGDTPSITDNAYPLLGGSNLGRESNVITFQKQLVGVNFELAKFDMIIGPSTVVTNRPNVEPVNASFPPMTNSPVPSLRLTPIPSRLKGNGKGQLKLFDQAQQEISRDDLICQRVYMVKKRKHSKSLAEEKEDGQRQKREVLDSTKSMAKASHQPSQYQ